MIKLDFVHTTFIPATLPVLKRRMKRKTFQQLSMDAKRKSVRDIRDLFGAKAAEYKTPVSTMAGFVIQQVNL